MIQPKEIEKFLQLKAAERQAARNALTAEKEQLAESETLLADLETAQNVLQDTAASIQQLAHKQIAHAVNQCLEAVFDKPYSLEIEFTRKRGKTEAELYFQREGLKVDPLTASGGGVVDVASFALRISRLVLSATPLRQVLILDEPFRNLHSTSALERVREMLQMIAEETKTQIIIVSDVRELQQGKVIQLENS